MSATPIERLNAALEGRYRIERELGQGGMATVYLADDIKHERKVALKVLKPELAAVVGAERFLAEIKTTANLQHPHILPLFDSGEADSYLFYVMPYVEGETLRDRLDREKQLPVDEAVRIATEVAEALDYAHGRAIVHRDIKPANILLQGGRVLVADFGIALAVSHAGAKRLTETGLSVGTPQYMSPEQATGDRELDGRSDLYSLACITYEMLAGDPPYTASTAQAILAKILTEEPKPLREVRRSVPAHVAAAIGVALHKLPADRFQSALEFAGAMTGARPFPAARLRGVRGGARDDLPLGLTTPNRRTGTLLVVTLAAVAGIGYVVGSASEQPGAIPALSTRMTFDETAGLPRLSPDGEQLAYVTSECPPDLSCRAQIMVQDLAGGDPVSLGPTVRTERGELGPTYFRDIAWSPDGQRVLFTAIYAQEPTRTGIYSMPRLGGTPTVLVPGEIGGVVMRPGADVVDWVGFPEGQAAARVIRSRSESGEVETHPITSDVAYLDWSPDGRWLALIGHQEFGAEITGPALTLVSSDWEVSDRLEIDRERGEQWLRIQWSPTGDAVYTLLGGDLLKVAVDLQAGSFVGAPVVVIPALEAVGITARGQFDVSRDGQTMVYTRTSQRSELRALEVTRDGLRSSTLAAGTTTRDHPTLSPDGELVAYTREDPLGTNIYFREFVGGREWAFTTTPGHKTHPRWSSDGTALAYVGHEPDGAWLFTASTGGGQSDRRARVSAGRFPPYAWFPDGERILLYGETGMMSILRLNGAANDVEELFDLPGQGPLWGLLVGPTNESLATFNFSLGADGIGSLWVDIGSLTRQAPDWETVFRGPWATFDQTAYQGGVALTEWRWQTPQAWEGDQLIISQSHRPGNRAFGGLWALPIRGDQPTRLFDLGDHCGAPSYVARDASGQRMVCIYRQLSSDIWKIENFDPDAAGN